MRVNNKILSILLAAGMATCITTPLYLTGCAMKEKESIEQTTVSDENEKDTKSKTIRLEDDFYGYVNAETLRNTDLNMKYGAAGSFVECEVKTQAQLDSVIDGIVAGDTQYEAGSNQQLIRDTYDQVQNYDKEKSDASTSVRSILKEIFMADSVSDLTRVAGKVATKLGFDSIFGFDISESVDNPNEYALAFYGPNSLMGIRFEDMAKGEQARVQCKKLALDVLKAAGVDEEEAERRADALTLLGIEIAAQGPSPTISLENMKAFTDEEISKYFDAATYANSMGIQNPYHKWFVVNEEYFAGITAKWNDEKNIEAFQTWLAISLIQDSAPYLSSEFDELKYTLGEHTESADEQAKEFIKNYLPEQLGEEYAKAFYTEDTDKKVREMCEQIRSSYREVISNAEWLSEKTREGLLKKLENLKFVTGLDAFRQIDPEDAKLIGKDIWETRTNLREKQWNDKIEALSRPRKINGQNMWVQTVNACYWLDNVVHMTIAIVNEPFFSAEQDMATNLGGLGMVIGHEVGHAFDANGMNWDENGYYNPDWISEEDRQALKDRSQKCVDYYNDYTIMGVYHVDGQKTLSENYADLGSMEIITNIAKTKEDRKKLFTNFAKIWSSLNSDVYAIELLKMDEHSPDMVRCNAVLSSCEAFYETYDIKESDGMYVEKDKRVSRW